MKKLYLNNNHTLTCLINEKKINLTLNFNENGFRWVIKYSYVSFSVLVAICDRFSNQITSSMWDFFHLRAISNDFVCCSFSFQYRKDNQMKSFFKSWIFLNFHFNLHNNSVASLLYFANYFELNNSYTLKKITW